MLFLFLLICYVIGLLIVIHVSKSRKQAYIELLQTSLSQYQISWCLIHRNSLIEHKSDLYASVHSVMFTFSTRITKETVKNTLLWTDYYCYNNLDLFKIYNLCLCRYILPNVYSYLKKIVNNIIDWFRK